jgi:hypothetical protein
MFAADNLSDVVAAYVLGNCPNWFVDPNPPPIVGELHNRLAGNSSEFMDYIDDDAFSAPNSLGKMHLEDISLGIVSIGPPLGFAFGDLDVGAKMPGDRGSALFDNTPMDEVVFSYVAGYTFSESTGVPSKCVPWGITNEFASPEINHDYVSKAALTGGQEGEEVAAAAFAFNVPYTYPEPESAENIDVLGYSWGVSMPSSYASMSQFFPEVEIILDAYSKNLEIATDGTLGRQAGDAAGWQSLLLPYLEQENLFKIRVITNNNDPEKMLTDISDGTSNTMMLATREGGEVVSNFLVHEPTGPQGIIAILIGLAADPSGAGGHEAAGTAAPLDIWEHAAMDRNGPATGGIIAILIGLMADPSDPSGNTASAVNSQPPASADEFFSRFANTTLDDQALVATTFGRGSAESQITHDVEFEKWADASQFERAQTSSTFYDLLISSYLEPTPGNHASSILHEDNEFYFPRM